MIRKPLGYQQITVLTGATALTVPAGAQRALVQCQVASVRWRDDGTNPTGTVGMLLGATTGAGDYLLYDGDLAAIKFIETAINAVLNVAYYD